MLKKNLLKVVVLSSFISLAACGDDNNSVAAGPVDPNNPGLAVDPNNPGTDPNVPGTVDPNVPGAEIASSASTTPAVPGTDPNVPSTDPNIPGAEIASSASTTPVVPGTDPMAPGVETPASSAVEASSSASVPGSSSTDDICAASSLPNACKDDPSKPASSDSKSVATSSSSEKKVESSSSEEKKVSSSSEAPAPKGIFLADSKEEEKDIMQVEYKTRTGWDGAGILSYPKQLSSTQKHGIVVWGPGGGTEPGAYEGMIRRLASHGFVVIALKESPGDASQAMKALDWMDKQNKDSNSPLFGKLDMDVVGCSGHSMGGLESEQAVIKDKRVKTAFLNNSGDWNGQGANKVPTDRTIAILYGEVGMEKDNAKNDYNNAGVKAPACLIEMNGGPRNSEGGYGHGSGSWDGMAATVAWMRWHLGGETERKADFVGTSGKYIDGSIIGKQGHWKTQCKNF